MAKVEHFEIPADDIDRAQKFYKAVFDFSYQPWADDMGMLNSPDGEGINGDLHVRGSVPHPTVVFTVDNIENSIAAVVANGGEQVGEIQALDENSRWAYVKDSEGNLIGVYDEKQPDEKQPDEKQPDEQQPDEQQSDEQQPDEQNSDAA